MATGPRAKRIHWQDIASIEEPRDGWNVLLQSWELQHESQLTAWAAGHKLFRILWAGG